MEGLIHQCIVCLCDQYDDQVWQSKELANHVLCSCFTLAGCQGLCIYYLKETCLSSLQVKLFTYFVSTIGTCVEKTMTGSLSSKESYTSHTFTL